jgi:pyrroline-5-carboxylate reductase
MSFNRKKVGVIGAGAMGSAITRGFLKADPSTKYCVSVFNIFPSLP